jgi:hypothetical protein
MRARSNQHNSRAAPSHALGNTVKAQIQAFWKPLHHRPPALSSHGLRVGEQMANCNAMSQNCDALYSFEVV